MASVKKIADEIAEDYKDEVPIFVGVLNGAFMFVSDFLKFYPYPCEVSFVKLSSYSGLTSTGIVETLLILHLVDRFFGCLQPHHGLGRDFFRQ